jgi:DNA-binding response OmpR family regulator
VEKKMMGQSTNDNNPLSGVRVLVVEDDTLLAMDLKETLVEAGAIVVDVCQTLDEGMARANDDDFAVAVLDFSLGPDTASPLARRLVRRGLPFILYTGKSRREPSLAEWSDRPIVEKPAPSRVLVSALRDVLSR